VDAVTYQLVVRGEVGDRFAVLFDGMRFTRRDGFTTLTGRVADQAQLLGLVERAQELGFEILSLKQLSGVPCCSTAKPTRNVEKGMTSWIRRPAPSVWASQGTASGDGWIDPAPCHPQAGHGVTLCSRGEISSLHTAIRRNS
jgi:hypothetical protein